MLMSSDSSDQRVALLYLGHGGMLLWFGWLPNYAVIH